MVFIPHFYPLSRKIITSFKLGPKIARLILLLEILHVSQVVGGIKQQLLESLVKEQLKITQKLRSEVRGKCIRDTNSKAAGTAGNLWNKARMQM